MHLPQAHEPFSPHSLVLRREWYPVARSQDVARRPMGVAVLDLPVVLFRAPDGRAVAWLDRCPHRNAPLSVGRCDRDGNLECPYHGWKFSPEGQCVDIPGKVTPLEKAYRTEPLPVREESGLVFVAPLLDGTAPAMLPYLPPYQSEPGYTTVVRQVEAAGSLEAVAENALDVPHTAVLHRGLFRGEKRNRIKATVRRYRDRIETEYIGEPPPTGLVAKLLSLGKGDEVALTVQHWDRFFLPNVLQVEYRLGEATHFCITALLTPLAPHRTRLFAVATFKTPLPGRALALLLEPVGRLVFSQDRRILSLQSDVIRRMGGERFISTELDTMGPAIHRLLKTAHKEEQAAGSADEAASSDGSSPAGVSRAGASPAGASPAGASPAGASPAGASPAGASAGADASRDSAQSGFGARAEVARAGAPLEDDEEPLQTSELDLEA